MFKRCLSWSTQIWFAAVTICVGYGKADILVFLSSDSHKVEQGFRDAPARFGGALPAEGFRGVIAVAEPLQACKDIKPPPNNTRYQGNNWIVVIARFNCSFEEKIRRAQKAGFDAAIVHNVGSNELEQMSAKDATNITIPSVFVSEFTGSLLKEVYRYDEDYFVLINDMPINFNTHLLLPFAIVVGICFLVMVIFMIVRCIKDRRRQRRHRLPNSSLKKIPTHKYTKGDPYETCAICLEDYLENEKLRVLPCAHAYHTKCIDPWLTKNRRVCPVCKRKVFAADERVETDSESDSDADDSTPLIRENNRSGTQGGTFTPQTENPFWRHIANRRRRASQHSGSSYESPAEGHNEVGGGTEADTESTNTNGDLDPRNSPVFLVSDCHSINGEMSDLERSVSSTKLHTVNLSTEVDESSSALDRRQQARAAARIGANNFLATSVVPRTSENNDVII
ncbi:E3 ubiquitin-protein ligase RNF13-like isoform X2 [Phymastichus coffea]|uniref:E3 ubiquitin-protein ligase RNF13-like isoform X2 n=1 Tax=Phymastichus coffea TaxID=108790 RepID=UPI00273AB4FC|nr:E3 ubiquitin-protein ligase RNF13-like isoform X2 [Phymastichus coffea]